MGSSTRYAHDAASLVQGSTSPFGIGTAHCGLGFHQRSSPRPILAGQCSTLIATRCCQPFGNLSCRLKRPSGYKCCERSLISCAEALLTQVPIECQFVGASLRFPPAFWQSGPISRAPSDLWNHSKGSLYNLLHVDLSPHVSIFSEPYDAPPNPPTNPIAARVLIGRQCYIPSPIRWSQYRNNQPGSFIYFPCTPPFSQDLARLPAV